MSSILSIFLVYTLKKLERRFSEKRKEERREQHPDSISPFRGSARSPCGNHIDTLERLPLQFYGGAACVDCARSGADYGALVVAAACTYIFPFSRRAFFVLGGFCCDFVMILRYYPLLPHIKVVKILLLVFRRGSRKGYCRYTLPDVSGEDRTQRAHILPYLCTSDKLDMTGYFLGALLWAACAHLSQQIDEVGAVSDLEPPHYYIAGHGYRRVSHGLPDRQVLTGQIVDQYKPQRVETLKPVV